MTDIAAADELADDELVPQDLAIFSQFECPWVLWPVDRAPDPVVDRLHDAGTSLRRLALANPQCRIVIATFVHFEGDDTIDEFRQVFGPLIRAEVQPKGEHVLRGAIFVLAIPGGA